MHLRWCKHIGLLGVHSKSSNNAVLSELGRYPLMIDIFVTQIKFWKRLTTAKDNSLIYDAYKENECMITKEQSCWLKSVTEILNKLGMGGLLTNPTPELTQSMLTKMVQDKLRQIYERQLRIDIYNDNRMNDDGNKLRTYRKFKHTTGEEKYLSLIHDPDTRKNMTRLRISAHNLPIEAGRHKRPKKIPVTERFCELCTEREIGDEYHLMMTCRKFDNLRNNLFQEITGVFPAFEQMEYMNKFIFIMQCNDADLAQSLSKYLGNVTCIRGNLWQGYFIVIVENCIYTPIYVVMSCYVICFEQNIWNTCKQMMFNKASFIHSFIHSWIGTILFGPFFCQIRGPLSQERTWGFRFRWHLWGP